MTPTDWLTSSPPPGRPGRAGLRGVVILHGTDTLEETAWFLHLTLPAGKAGGALRCARPSPGGRRPRQPAGAVRHAASPEARDKGVLVVMNGQIFGARAASSRPRTGLDAFRIPEPWQAARPDGPSPGWRWRNSRGWTSCRLCRRAGDLIDASVAAGARGLVLALVRQRQRAHGLACRPCGRRAGRAWRSCAAAARWPDRGSGRQRRRHGRRLAHRRRPAPQRPASPDARPGQAGWAAKPARGAAAPAARGPSGRRRRNAHHGH